MPYFSLASDKRGYLLQRYLKQFPVFGKALTNYFIMPNLISRGGSSVFFGLTRLLCKMFLLPVSRDVLGVPQCRLLAPLSHSHMKHGYLV
jgi:hypothetical protein